MTLNIISHRLCFDRPSDTDIAGKEKEAHKKRRKSAEYLNTSSAPALDKQSELNMERTSNSRKSSVRLRKYSEPQADATPLSPPTTNKTTSSKSPHTANNLDKSGYMTIIELMSSDGFWELTQPFAEVLSINYTQLRESCPFADPVLKNKSHDYYESKQLDVYEKIWVTALAIIWLRTGWMEYESEWVLIDLKVRQWLARQKLPKGFVLEDVFLISQQTFKILTNNRNTAV